jgi:glycyl-tRNA synthetase
MEDKILFYLTVQESPRMIEEAEELARQHAKKLGFTEIQPLVFRDLTEVPHDIYDSLPSPGYVMRGGLTRPRDFNLMFKTTVGAVAEASEGVAYLRPETAQVQSLCTLF